MDKSKDRKGNAAEVRQLISFIVGAEEYGLEVLRVKEVIRLRQVTWLPKAPSCVMGIINLRGDVIPIVDLRERFGLAAQQQTAITRVIVVEAEGTHVGMVVDSASQVLRAPVDQFEHPPMMIGEGAKDFVKEVAKLGDRLIIMIDVDRILSTKMMSQIADSLQVAAKEPVLGTA
jgi:purine-binding chemotaxis protein CheW